LDCFIKNEIEANAGFVEKLFCKFRIDKTISNGRNNTGEERKG
jgi:hypothetical protein